MAKIRLGNAPESISYVAKFTGWDGKEDSIKGKCKYRTRKQFGEMIDGLTKKAQEPRENGDEVLSNEQLQELTLRANAEYLGDCIETWDIVDAEVSVDTLIQLGNECPQAITALMNAYRESVFEGRLGN